MKKKSLFLALLPLGVGQFQNGNVLLGLVVGAAQVGGVGWAFYSTSQLDAFKRANLRCSEVSADANPKPDCIPNAEFDSYVAGVEQAAMIGLAVAGLAWIGGATEAIINMNDAPARPPASAYPPAAPPAYYGYDATRTPERLALAEAAATRDSMGPVLRLRPVANPLVGGLGLNVRFSF